MYVVLKLLSGLRVSWLFWSCVPLIEPVSVELISLDEAFQFRTDTPAGLLSVDDALTKLEKLDPRQGHIVEMRFYGGLTVDETGRGPQHLFPHRGAGRDACASLAVCATQRSGIRRFLRLRPALKSQRREVGFILEPCIGIGNLGLCLLQLRLA